MFSAHMNALGHASIVLALSLASTSVGAQVTNGSFENGSNPPTGWTLGTGSRVEVLQTANFGPNTIPVPDGIRYVLVSTGPGNVPGTPGGDLDGNGTTETDISTLRTTFSTTAADETLSLQWAFLTDEIGPGGQGLPLFDDVFAITVDGVSILRGSVRKPGGSSPYPDTAAYDSRRYTVNSTGLTDNSDFGAAAGGGRTPFERLCVSIASAGAHTLQFLVADQGDSIHDSALLVDAVQVSSSCNPTVQVTDSAGASLEVKGGSFVFTAVSNGRVALSTIGPVLAFRSNGNHNGDNPNLQEQIWTATPSGAAYTITRVTSAVGADFGDPQLDATGQWLTFAASGDLVAPGNADGNSEIFRYQRGSAALVQITNTTACTNEQPTIGGAGGRIAFVSDCGLAPGSSGSEIVLWDGTFRGIDTSGCTSRAPRVTRDASGRYVTFVTTCAGQYPGTVNADGGEEVVRWDAATDLYRPITNTAPGFTNDSASSSADGRFVSFVSTANHGGQNPTGAFAVFRYDAQGGTFLRLTVPDPLALYTYAAIDDGGGFVAVERVDLITSAFEIFLIDTTDPDTLIPVAAGGPGVTNLAPAVGVVGGRALVAYQSDGDPSGGNPDANVEIWVGGGAFAPPQPQIYCSSPNLAIPGQGTVSNTLNVTDSGTLADLDVVVRIAHSWVGDLRVELRNLTSGTTRRIIDRPGRPPGFGCSGDDLVATLDDEATLRVENQCVTPGPVAIQGTFSPEESLSAFDAQAIAASWQLRIMDQSPQGAGTLLEWCLIATPQ